MGANLIRAVCKESFDSLLVDSIQESHDSSFNFNINAFKFNINDGNDTINVPRVPVESTKTSGLLLPALSKK